MKRGWLIVNKTHKNIFQLYRNKNSKKNAFQNVVYSHLFRSDLVVYVDIIPNGKTTCNSYISSKLTS